MSDTSDPITAYRTRPDAGRCRFDAPYLHIRTRPVADRAGDLAKRSHWVYGPKSVCLMHPEGTGFPDN